MSEVTRKRKFHHLQKYCNVFTLHYLISQNHDEISKLQSLYKVHLNMISNGELLDPLCDSVNRGLTSFSQIANATYLRYSCIGLFSGEYPAGIGV